MSADKFWKKSWDQGLEDLDPSIWEKSYTDAIKPAFEKFPDKTALAFMGVEISFSELDRYSNRFAGMLLDEGIEKGDVVGINLPNIPEYVIAWLGILKAGCIVSGVSPLLSAEEMEFQLKDSRAKGLVTLDAIFAARFYGIAANLPDLKIVAFTSVGGFLPAIKRTLGKMLGKIPKGKVTPVKGKKIYNFIDIINNTKYSSEDPGISLTADDRSWARSRFRPTRRCC